MSAHQTQHLKAPFVWFGAKSRVASLIWQRLGSVDNYCEPFAGSLAVLLRRPRGWQGVETVNDLDGLVTNVWRAVRADPEGVAYHCNWPVSELDLHARHRWLVLSEPAREFRERMRSDPDAYDVRIAGWWLWGINQWIGGGWCRELDVEKDQRPALHAGMATTKALPEGRPQLGDAFDVGRGVHSHGQFGTEGERLAWLTDWFQQIRDRLRLVRICCGHWLRVCDSDTVTTRLGTVGLFLDPPYAKSIKRMQAWVKHLRGEGPEPPAARASSRDGGLYATDHHDVDRLVAEVHLYCAERGGVDGYRIALAGYEGEHDALKALGWEVVAWQTSGAYGNQGKGKGGVRGRGKDNAARERLWFSPGCNRERTLFDEVGCDEGEEDKPNGS